MFIHTTLISTKSIVHYLVVCSYKGKIKDINDWLYVNKCGEHSDHSIGIWGFFCNLCEINWGKFWVGKTAVLKVSN